jgi:hypothetical protein
MRAVSLTRLKLRHRDGVGTNNTSVPAGYIASGPVAFLSLCLGLAAVALQQPTIAGVAALAAAATAALNAEFLAAIAETDGWPRALAAIPLLWLELVVATVGAAVGIVTYPFGRRY